MKTFNEDTVDVDLTPTQRRIAAQLVSQGQTATDISYMLGGKNTSGRADIAVSFLKKLDKRLAGSWWVVVCDFGRWRVVRRVVRRVVKEKD